MTSVVREGACFVMAMPALSLPRHDGEPAPVTGDGRARPRWISRSSAAEETVTRHSSTPGGAAVAHDLALDELGARAGARVRVRPDDGEPHRLGGGHGGPLLGRLVGDPPPRPGPPARRPPVCRQLPMRSAASRSFPSHHVRVHVHRHARHLVAEPLLHALRVDAVADQEGGLACASARGSRSRRSASACGRPPRPPRSCEAVLDEVAPLPRRGSCRGRGSRSRCPSTPGCPGSGRGPAPASASPGRPSRCAGSGRSPSSIAIQRARRFLVSRSVLTPGVPGT